MLEEEFINDPALAEQRAKKAEEAEKQAKIDAKNAKKGGKARAAEAKKDQKKKDDKKVDDDVPMDNAAIKAYSSVIADAAEDSEPATPVIYTEVKEESKADQRLASAPM